MFGYLGIKNNATWTCLEAIRKYFKLPRFLLFCCTQSSAQSYTHRTCLYIYRKLALIVKLVIPKMSTFCMRGTVLILVIIMFYNCGTHLEQTVFRILRQFMLKIISFYCDIITARYNE